MLGDGKRWIFAVAYLLVGLVSTVGVTDLAAEVVLLADHVVADTLSVSVLEVSVEVDLADTVANSIEVLLLGGTGTTVEDEEDGLVVLGTSLVLDVLLVLAEELRAELDVTGLVDTVNVTETSGNGEEGRDLGKGLVDLVNVFGLGVEGVVVNALVVNTVLFTTGDTNFLHEMLGKAHYMCANGCTYHLEPLLHGSSALKVLLGGLDVVLDLLLGKINHVGREAGKVSAKIFNCVLRRILQRGASLLEELLIGVEQTVQPWQKLLGAVVGVEDNGDTVGRGKSADVVSSSNATGNGCLLVTVGNALSGEVGSTTLGEL